LICGGYNDAAAVLAHSVSGSEAAFVNKMNESAMEWGMTSTVYANSSGIMSGATTTLSDVVILSKKAYENEKYLEMSSALRYEIAADADSPAHVITNRNALIYGREIEYRNVYASGLCAGTDGDMGYCVSTVVKKGELSYLCVVMGSYRAGDDTYSYIVANRLISWAFSSFNYRTVIDKEQFSYPVRVERSDTVNEINAIPKESVSAFLSADIDNDELTFHVRLHNKSAKAPIKEGDELGYLIVTVGDEEIARALLVSESDVIASKFMIVMENLGNISRSRFFVIFAICFVIIGSGVIVALVLLNKHFKKKNRYRYKL
jgi:D-alanyl-D-alanine carboxypeptidase (penicillin-binding protein 5/6)